MWSSCQSAGNIVGAYVVAIFLPYGYAVCVFSNLHTTSIQDAFIGNGALIFAGGVVLFFALVSDPHGLYDGALCCCLLSSLCVRL